MSKPIIGVDLDDVIYPFTTEFMKFVNKQLGVDKTIKNCLVYSLAVTYGIPEQQIYDFIALFMNTRAAKNALPIPGARTSLKTLKEHYDVHIVTARPETLNKDTRNWLDKDFKDLYSDIHYCSFYSLGDKKEVKLSKTDVCKQLNAFCLVDDNVWNATEFHRAGFLGILFGNYPWQSSAERDIVKASNWAEVKQILVGKEHLV
jgi:5'(3')-deoxyribonucleotidase